MSDYEKARNTYIFFAVMWFGIGGVCGFLAGAYWALDRLTYYKKRNEAESEQAGREQS